jgi:hypothetical protein
VTMSSGSLIDIPALLTKIPFYVNLKLKKRESSTSIIHHFRKNSGVNSRKFGVDIYFSKYKRGEGGIHRFFQYF